MYLCRDVCLLNNGCFWGIRLIQVFHTWHSSPRDWRGSHCSESYILALTSHLVKSVVNVWMIAWFYLCGTWQEYVCRNTWKAHCMRAWVLFFPSYLYSIIPAYSCLSVHIVHIQCVTCKAARDQSHDLTVQWSTCLIQLADQIWLNLDSCSSNRGCAAKVSSAGHFIKAPVY